jgi:hypothetical protein
MIIMINNDYDTILFTDDNNNKKKEKNSVIKFMHYVRYTKTFLKVTINTIKF